MKELKTIREKIRTINPIFTDEVLDLLYEYIITKNLNISIKTKDTIKNDSVLRNELTKITSTTIDSKKVNIKGYFTY